MLRVRRRAPDPSVRLFAIDILAPDGAYVDTLSAGAPWPVAFMPDGDPIGIATDALDVDRLVVHEMIRPTEATAGDR